ncbi:MAG TPA: hypothetical protein VMN39_10495 [Longimicrobiaceae bacterium]|nr:hypothetical protein [Longimicrobiaceae bacterium]
MDEARESELVGRFTKLSNRRIPNPSGQGTLDAVLLGAHDKLQRRLGEAKAEREDSIQRHREDIIEAMLAASYAAEADQNAKAEAFRASTEAWTAHLQAWRPLLEPLGLSGNDLPQTNPASDAVRAIVFHLANGYTTPAPQSLVRQPEPIVIDHRTQREPVGSA